jgi:hypothetical protein
MLVRNNPLRQFVKRIVRGTPEKQDCCYSCDRELPAGTKCVIVTLENSQLLYGSGRFTQIHICEDCYRKHPYPAMNPSSAWHIKKARLAQAQASETAEPLNEYWNAMADAHDIFAHEDERDPGIHDRMNQFEHHSFIFKDQRDWYKRSVEEPHKYPPFYHRGKTYKSHTMVNRGYLDADIESLKELGLTDAQIRELNPRRNPAKTWHVAKIEELMREVSPMLRRLQKEIYLGTPHYVVRSTLSLPDRLRAYYLLGQLYTHAWHDYKDGRPPHDHERFFKSARDSYSEAVMYPAKVESRLPHGQIFGGYGLSFDLDTATSLVQAVRQLSRGKVDAEMESLREEGLTSQQIMELNPRRRRNPPLVVKVWEIIKRAPRAYCAYCPEFIHPGEKCIAVQYIHRSVYSNTETRHIHLKCWHRHGDYPPIDMPEGETRKMPKGPQEQLF